MQTFKEALDKLNKSDEFKDWKEKNSSCFLSYGFYIVDKEETNWKIGYYDKELDKVTSFDIGKKVSIEPEEEVFKKEETVVKKIDIDSIKYDITEALAVANSVQKEQYSSENPIKVIAIIQKIKDDQVWNMTFLTQNFNTLNFKINTKNGEVLDQKLVSLMQFGSAMPGLKGKS